MCHKVKKDVDKFVGDAKQFDDITLLSVKLNCTINDESIAVYPYAESMNYVYNFIENKDKSFGLDKTISNKIKLVTDEIYSNIVNYSGATRAKISFCKTDKSIFLTFYDNGRPYNPLTAETPDISVNVNDRKEGGMGIYIVKNIASRIDYSNKDGLNILTIVFE